MAIQKSTTGRVEGVDGRFEMKTVGCAILALLTSVIYSLVASNVISAPSITGEDTAMALAYVAGAGLAAGGLVLMVQGRAAARVLPCAHILAVIPSLRVRQKQRELSAVSIDHQHIFGWQSLDETEQKEI
jgi:hypothetical protein